MPNWTRNSVFFRAETPEKMQEIISSLGGIDADGRECDFTFNNFISVPKEIIDTRLDPNNGLHCMSDQEFEWRCSAWGTKWDACNVELERTDETHLILSFNTPWCAPAPVADAMRKHFGEALVAWIFLNEDDTLLPQGSEDALEAGFNYEDVEFSQSEHWRSL